MSGHVGVYRGKRRVSMVQVCMHVHATMFTSDHQLSASVQLEYHTCPVVGSYSDGIHVAHEECVGHWWNV